MKYKWIDAKIRNPKCEGTYLCYVIYYNGATRIVVKKFYKIGKSLYWATGCSKFYVTHWMELPDPPNVELDKIPEPDNISRKVVMNILERAKNFKKAKEEIRNLCR